MTKKRSKVWGNDHPEGCQAVTDLAPKLGISNRRVTLDAKLGAEDFPHSVLTRQMIEGAQQREGGPRDGSSAGPDSVQAHRSFLAPGRRCRRERGRSPMSGRIGNQRITLRVSMG